MKASKISMFSQSATSLRCAAVTGLALSFLAPNLAQAQSRSWGGGRRAASDRSVWRTARVPKFKRIANFEVSQKERKFENGVEVAPDRLDEETVAEIITTNADGTLLVYTDGEQKQLGFVDIIDPSTPRPDGVVDLDGEPTSVSIVGNYAVAGVNTSESFTAPSGHLVIIDLDTRTEVHRIDLGGQPDSVAVSKDERQIAVAMENERDEDFEVDGVEGGLPQAPAGDLKVITVSGDSPSDWSMRKIELTGLAEIGESDPEPEYVDFNSRGEIVVTLQENNHLVVVDTQNGDAITHFSAGTVDLDQIDIAEETPPNIDPSGSLQDVPREPDAVTWISDDLFATANEGDFNGGSRGYTVFSKNGDVVFDAGNGFEHLAISAGHYPDHRSKNKGSEPEGIEFGRYKGKDLLFVGSERGNFVSVYQPRNDAQRMELVQMLPTAGVGPEGLLAIPQRGLFVVANEKDDAGEGFRATITIFEQGTWANAPAEYPQIASRNDASGAPIGWAALSGLTSDSYNWGNWGKMWAVADSAIGPASIYRIKPLRSPAMIVDRTVVTENGEPVNLDLEGIAKRANGGFWLASEGKAAYDKDDDGNIVPVENRALANELIRVNNAGEIQERVGLPEGLAARAKKFGFEGVTVSYDANGEEVVTAVIQLPWEDAPGHIEGATRIARYVPSSGEWSFYSYPLETSDKGWVGLSEITHLWGDQFAVIERDKQQGMDAQIKRVYEITLPDRGTAFPEAPAQLQPKKLLLDLLPQLQQRNGWVPDKVEGMTVDFFGRFTFVTDNDGLKDAVGETLFWSSYPRYYGTW